MTDRDASLNATPDDIADALIGQLVRDPDAVRRYHAARALADRLPWVRAISAKQLELEGGTMSAAADALGVSRQYLDQLYRETDTPGPRADRGRTERPAHLYGRYLAACRAAADLAARHGAEAALDEYAKLEQTATQTTTMYPTLSRAASRWLTRVRRDGATRQARECGERLTAAEVELLPWVTANQRHLTLAEQADVALAYHAARIGIVDRKK